MHFNMVSATSEQQNGSPIAQGRQTFFAPLCALLFGADASPCPLLFNPRPVDQLNNAHALLTRRCNCGIDASHHRRLVGSRVIFFVLVHQNRIAGA